MRGRLQVLVIVLTGVFLAGMILIFAVFTMSPDIAALNRPILLTAFIVALFLSLVCIAWLLRWLLRPYTQLIGEAKRAPVEHSGTTQNEAEFVLETFQSVLAQLQAQRKELERLTAEASQRADSAEKFSERIVASMPTGLVAFDSSGHATVINPPAGTLLETNTIGDHFRNVFQKAPDLARLVDDCLTTGKLFRREEINAVNGLGHPKRLGATVAPIDPATPGTARGVLCLLTDITEVTRLREQVALKRNLESLGEMSAGLAHEFKNAIAALHGYAQFLQSVDHDERGRTAASGLLQEVRNLSEMVTAFLNFARPQPLQLEDISLDELISDSARELTSLFADRRVELILADDAKGISIQADARMLRQALVNLVRNAAEAIPEENLDRRVIISTSVEPGQRDESWVTIMIRDTGKGIPTANLPKIFIPFFTTKSTGHGVGLALAHRVIAEHGGTLTAANCNDGGALFTVRLPAVS